MLVQNEQVLRILVLISNIALVLSVSAQIKKETKNMIIINKPEKWKRFALLIMPGLNWHISLIVGRAARCKMLGKLATETNFYQKIQITFFNSLFSIDKNN